METNQENVRKADYCVEQSEEDLGVFGPPVVQPARLETGPSVNLGSIARTEAVSSEDKARKEELARMAANMVITDEPRGSYFVRNPGL